ncbi:hypothetical protein [Planctomycetes bacterium TBK1r]|uniref:Uncharacterized protein n=1 Tax=Stieleria magnilauensis TaxID=2527963 RepID=A0ABX5XYQ5_9BACT|nr:hypothetical protein TBK1r_61930 [Planctomycetes bacterium TBK1r]
MTGRRLKNCPPPKPKGLPETLTEAESIEPGFLGTMDARTRLVRALKANYEAIVSDMGGPEEVSYVRNSLAERFTFLECLLESIEQDLASGKIDRTKGLARWTQAVNSLIGLSRVIGLNRRSSNAPWLDALGDDERGDG